MPRSLDPNSKISFVLACDVDKPEAVRPVIYGQPLSLSQQRRLGKALEGMRLTDADARFEAALDAADVCLIGWKNMIDPTTGEQIPFTRENVGEILDASELAEIFNAIMSDAKASMEDKKKLDLPPLSDAVNSVKPALESVGT